MKFFIVLSISLLLFSCGKNNEIKSTDIDYDKGTDTDNSLLENDSTETPETDAEDTAD